MSKITLIFGIFVVAVLLGLFFRWLFENRACKLRKSRERRLKEILQQLEQVRRETIAKIQLNAKISAEAIDRGSTFERGRSAGRDAQVQHNLDLIEKLEKEKSWLDRKLGIDRTMDSWEVIE